MACGISVWKAAFPSANTSQVRVSWAFEVNIDRASALEDWNDG